MPIAASAPNARRSRSASGDRHLVGPGHALVDELAGGDRDEHHRRDEHRLEHEDAAVAGAEQAPPSSRTIWTTPVTIVTTIAGFETRLNPRTAWTRSSSPGPASTTRATSTAPPTQTAIASACRQPIATPSAARSPPVRLKPMVATASAGIPSATSWVVGSITRSGRNATHADRRRAAAAPARPVRATRRRQIEPRRRAEPAPERRCRSPPPRRPTRRATCRQRDDPRAAHEATASRYSTPSGHAAAIVTSAPNSTAMPERGQQPAEPQRPASGLGLVERDHDDGDRGARRRVVVVAVASRGRWSWSPSTVVSVAVGSFSIVNVMLPRAVRLVVGVADRPGRDAAALGKWIVDLDRQRASVVADVGRGMVISSALHCSDSVFCSPSSSAKVIDDLARRRREDGAVGRVGGDDLVVGVRRAGPEQQPANDRPRRASTTAEPGARPPAAGAREARSQSC